MKNGKCKLIFSLVQVDFKLWTSLLMIMEHVGHQFSSCFHWIFKNAMLLNFALIAWFLRKEEKHGFCVLFFGGFELEMPSFYRQEVWNVRQGRTWHFAIWSCLKGQERHFALKGNFLFSPCAIFGNLIQSPIITSWLIFISLMTHLASVRKLLDE